MLEIYIIKKSIIIVKALKMTLVSRAKDWQKNKYQIKIEIGNHLSSLPTFVTGNQKSCFTGK